MSRKRVLVALVVGCVLLAGCSGAGGGGGDAAPSGASYSGAEAGDEPATAAAEATASGGGDTGGSVAVARADRAVIKTGRIALTVDSFETAREQVGTLAREEGGYVASSSRETRGDGNRTWTVGVVTIRVPSERFTAAYESIQGLGTVRDASQDTRDVSDRLLDIEARLETLRAERARLRELYDAANDTEAVLRVSEKLADVQTEIERLKAQKRSLENRVAFSTITVELREERPPEPTPEPGYTDTPLGAAFLASVSGVVTVIETVAVTLAYALPYLLAFGLPLGGVGVVLLRRR